MIRILLDRAFDNEHHYIHAVGLSTDTKPTTGIITGSKFVAVDTGAGYLFDETAGEWNENQQLTEAVAAYLDDHPEALDQAAIEAMFGDQLDGIESDLGRLKSALTNGTIEENLLRSEMPGTSTTVTMDSNGNPTSIVHTENSETVRTDSFVWSTNSVVETRTLASGKYITITTNLETLAQTISAVQEVA